MPQPALPFDVQVLVLCADWCSQCRSFLPLVQDLSGLSWVDIEDAGLDAEDLDISAFPSAAIFRPAGVLRYLGPVRADLEGFMLSVAQLSRLGEIRVPEALRKTMWGGGLTDPRRHSSAFKSSE